LRQRKFPCIFTVPLVCLLNYTGKKKGNEKGRMKGKKEGKRKLKRRKGN
jgi:hypothetical protein